MLMAGSLRRQDISTHDTDYVKIDKFLCYLRKDFNYLRHVNEEESQKI